MSNEMAFASSDEPSFVWPATETGRRHRSDRHQDPTPPYKRAEADRILIRQLRHAQEIARRWELGDDDVTIRDIIDALR